MGCVQSTEGSAKIDVQPKRDPTTPHHPLLKADEIDTAPWRTLAHSLKPEAVRTQSSMSDAVGMKNIAVHKSRLEPGKESCLNHYHLNDSEWMYILSGTGTLILIDSSASLLAQDSLPPQTSLSGHIPPPPKPEDLPREERPLGPGDFVGLEGGARAARYSHSMIAGPGGLEYLLGGVKTSPNICAYPE
ncbi:hypothetical protein B9479_005480 [Cryptococcus floricola]|uniref:Cupin type-1 domain-containing protein n=1 Tax=Cryptococcus floricola TaxID=2591691 RepID=A0A5D3AUH7_9TREE|nr:hypothetical protein B9479_005480 [Cryptococcus floricola]